MSSNVDLVADRLLAFEQFVSFASLDFTGATYRMQLRTKPDVTGSPLASITGTSTSAGQITMPYNGSATVAAHITAGRLTAAIYGFVNPATGVAYAPTDTILVSQVRLFFTTTAMAALPAADNAGDDVELSYDLLVTQSGDFERKQLYGSFIVKGTVTQ